MRRRGVRNGEALGIGRSPDVGSWKSGPLALRLGCRGMFHFVRVPGVMWDLNSNAPSRSRLWLVAVLGWCIGTHPSGPLLSSSAYFGTSTISPHRVSPGCCSSAPVGAVGLVGQLDARVPPAFGGPHPWQQSSAPVGADSTRVLRGEVGATGGIPHVNSRARRPCHGEQATPHRHGRGRPCHDATVGRWHCSQSSGTAERITCRVVCSRTRRGRPICR